MAKPLVQRFEETMSFARYLSWADLQSRLYDAEMSRKLDGADERERRDHEWRSFGIMCHLYSSLHVVVEAWDALGLSDAVIDRLLDDPKQFGALLRRFRNAVFHYQKSLLDPRFIELLALGAVHVYWIHALQGEFLRFLSDDFASSSTDDSQRVTMRQNVEAILGWYPAREAPKFEDLIRELSAVRSLLDKHPNDGSKERAELEAILKQGESTLENSRREWAVFRGEVLRSAGVS